MSFVRSENDYNLYYKDGGLDKTILLIYVNGLFLTGGDAQEIERVKNQLKKEFDISNLGLICRYLGVEFQTFPNGIFLNQTEYSLQLLRNHGMDDCRPEHIPLPSNLTLLSDMSSPPTDTTNYCTIVGKLIFLTTTRPDIAYVVSNVSRFMSHPQIAHLDAIFHILRYINKTTNYGLFLCKR